MAAMRAIASGTEAAGPPGTPRSGNPSDMAVTIRSRPRDGAG